MFRNHKTFYLTLLSCIIENQIKNRITFFIILLTVDGRSGVTMVNVVLPAERAQKREIENAIHLYHLVEAQPVLESP